MEMRDDAIHTPAKLPRIEEVAPVSEEDEACLAEIRDVLLKHNRLNRFGVSLLHDHFDVGDDELMVEVCDVEQRKLISMPFKREDIAGSKTIETNWRFEVNGTGRPILTCIESCFFSGGKHLGPYHDVVN